MIDNAEIDLQAQGILDGLKSLESLLDKPVAREALGLAKEAGTSEQYKILLRLKRSLTQYLERKGDLYYVGFLGHFSTGKSSTINSLLELWKSDRERPTGLNPTDNTITLITRENNIKSLLGVINEGHVVIRSQAIDSPLLDNIVLADTPGTGDPHLIEEIAREFLPICDIILFLFSAASPLDQTDMPLLLELNKRLPFVPIKFVVTRADELSKNRGEPLSEENIDGAKRAEFLAEVVLRTNKLLTSKHRTESDFILIDNRSRYQIEPLREYLREKSDPSNPSVRISMHSHKLNFYLMAAKELRNFFSAFLEGKLSVLTEIVGVSEKNIGKYNELVRISNDNLTLAWVDQLAAIRKIRTDSADQIQVPGDLPSAITAFASVSKAISDSSRDITGLSHSYAKTIADRFVISAQSQFREYFSEIREKLSNTPLEDMSPGSKDIGALIVKPNLEGLEIVPRSRLNNLWTDIAVSHLSALENSMSDLRYKVSRADKYIQSRRVLIECEEQIKTAMASLRSDFVSFFYTVELYRDGVFSHQNKNSISTLGIGKQLDDLEASFDDEDRVACTNEAIEEMFPKHLSSYERSSKRFSELEAKLRTLQEEVSKLKVSTAQPVKRVVDVEVDDIESSLLSDIRRELQSDVDHLVDRVDVELSALLLETKASFDGEMERATRRRHFRYAGLIVGGGLLASALYLSYRYLQSPVSQTLFWTVFWSIVANILGDAVGYFFASARDHFPQTKKQIRDRARERIRVGIKNILDRDVEGYIFKSLDPGPLSNKLAQAYAKILQLGPTDWKEDLANYLSTLRKAHAEFCKLRLEALAAVGEICDICTKYFDDQAHNLSVLNSVAGRIKARAIEPSSQLLESTRAQLRDVKTSIEGIEFL